MKNIYPRVWVDEATPPVALGGVNGAVRVTLGGVLKEAPRRKHVVAAEYVCGRLALAAGLPIPAGDLITLRNEDGGVSVGYLMLQVSSDGPPPVRGAAFVAAAPEIAARVVAFDSLVLNGDRHGRSLALPEDGGALVYDFSEAFFGQKQDDIAIGHEYLVSKEWDPFWGRDFLTAHLPSRAEFERAIRRVQTVPADLVDECVERVVVERLIPAPVGETLRGVLHTRRAHLMDYFERTDASVFPKMSKGGES